LNKTTEQLTKAVGVGLVAGTADFAAVTLWLHRSKTHNAYKLNPKLERLARIVVWASGTNSSEWATIHRQHHEFADTSKDPHSPVQQGRWGVQKLWLKNTFLYNKEGKRVSAAGEFPPDLQPDRLDRNKRAGLAASLAAHVAINKSIGNPGYMGAASWGFEKLFYIAGGNTVNSWGHAGAKPAAATLTGKITPHPDGSYGSDSAWVAAITLGEGRQKAHHDHPERIFFGDGADEMSVPRRLAQDIGGTIALGLVEHGLATINELPPPPDLQDAA